MFEVRNSKGQVSPARTIPVKSAKAQPQQQVSFVLDEKEFSIYRKAKRGGGGMDVSLLDRKTTEQIFVLIGASCFSFTSGFINGCALNGFGKGQSEPTCDANGTLVDASVRQSITGFTGGYTKSALYAAEGSYQGMGFEFAPLFCFVGGSYVCGLLMPDRKPFELGPMFGPLFLLGSLFASLAVVFAYLEYDERAPFYWLALNSGVSNGMTSIYSGGLIRSSNLTGPLTDIGVQLGKWSRGKLKEGYKLRIRVLLAVMFWTGALCSWWATEAEQYKALIINAVFFFAVGVCYMLYISWKNNVSLLDTALGRWDWGDALRMMGTGENGKSIQEWELVELFYTFDSDNSGTIDARELSAALLTQCKRAVPLKMVEEMLESADENGDCEIDVDEFTDLMRKHVDVENSGIAITSEGVSDLVARRVGKRPSRMSFGARMQLDEPPAPTTNVELRDFTPEPAPPN